VNALNTRPDADATILSKNETGSCVLFLRPRLLGDIIFTLPALELFARHFPGVKVVFLTEPAFADLVRLFPPIHEVLIMDRRPNARSLLNFRRHVQRLGCRAAVDFHSGPHSALLTRVSGVRYRIGYHTRNRNWAYTHLTPRHPQNAPSHSVANQVRLLEHFGIPHRPIPFYPRLSSPALREDLALGHDPGRVVIHVGAGNRFRDWGASNFHTLIDGILERGLRAALIGHSDLERATAAELSRRFTVDDLTGKLSLPEVYAFIAASGVYIGVDSGPLHLASLTKTPLIALYGPNLPAISGPWRNANVTILQVDLPCRPCSQHRCRYDRIRCMQEISPHDVLKAVDHYIR
jgi:heptosyltransferase-1